MIASIDLSLRSTGITVIDLHGNLVDFMLLTPAPQVWNNEELLIHIASEVTKFLSIFNITAIVIEGLSFNSFSSEKDKINGNFWHLRCALKERFNDIPIGIIAVTEWRSSVLSRAEQREIKKLTTKDAIKKACIDKLPQTVRDCFSIYLSNNKFPAKGLMDLTDAYWLAIYRLSLED